MPFLKVYTPQYVGGGKANHTGVFIETSPSNGEIFHVVGSVCIRGGGMKYVRQTAQNPADDEARQFVSGTMKLEGVIDEQDLEKVDEACKAVPESKEQLTLSGKKLYPNEPIRRCAQWTVEAVEELKKRGLLKEVDES
jgi:hypothetical protein